MNFNFCNLIIFFLGIVNGSYSSTDDTCSSVAADPSILLLKTFDGDVKGECWNTHVQYSKETSKEIEVLVWLSIPYAEPPINEHRFKKTVPVKPWENVIDGTKNPKYCLQYDEDGSDDKSTNNEASDDINSEDSYGNDEDNNSEDCLYLNIYIQSKSYSTRKESLKPILVYVHGGSYVRGDGASYEPSTIVAMSDIIVITINYRLNALGFMHLADTDVTGNQGLHDSTTALKWIYKNAINFGGDNTRITISGESAGAWSVGYHLFLKESWPYFRNGIMQSGGPTGISNSYRLLTSEEATDRAKLFLSFIGCESSSNLDALKCAQAVSSQTILTAYKELDLYMYTQEKYETELYLPVVDGIGFDKGIEKLVRDNDFKQCNIITGFNSDEFATFFVSTYNILGDEQSEYIRRARDFDYTNFLAGLRLVFKYYPIYPYVSDESLINTIVKKYFTENDLENIGSVNLVRKLSQIVSDFQYVCQSFDLAEYYSKSGNQAFVYEYNYKQHDRGIPEELNDYFGSATHGDELSMTFADILTDDFEHITKKDIEMAKNIVSYWTNFVKYNNPNPPISNNSNPFTSWISFLDKSKPIIPDDVSKIGRIIEFNNNGVKMKKGYLSHHCKLWGFNGNQN